MTKEGLAARVVDRQQVHRTMSKEEILHLFDFGDDELGQEIGVAAESNTGGNAGDSLKEKVPLPHGSSSSDKLIETLISRYYPRCIILTSSVYCISCNPIFSTKGGLTVVNFIVD